MGTLQGKVAKFALMQASIGAATGGNKRGTHANGFGLKGQLEIYDQPQQNSWLQIGPFKKALKDDQRPEVRIRFADASGRPTAKPPDSEADVRAISFSFVVDGKRQDFSMNNDPRFNFGNLTDFNNFLSFSLISAVSPGADPGDPNTPIGKLFVSNPDVAQSVMKAKKLNDNQLEKDVYAYHTENYYTGSAFSFGKDKSGKDRAAKFKLAWCGEKLEREKTTVDASGKILVNRAKLVERTTNAVNDEKNKEFGFELEVQILDAEKIKTAPEWPEGKRPRTGVDWVEDATLEWTDEVSTSYKLGKLTAIPKSVMSDAECENEPGFDVNKHNSDLFIPLGNINRGRAAVELQSQKLRAKVDPALLPPKSTPFTHTKTIEQGWDVDDRDIFWYLPQGAYVLPYDWFMVLTDPATNKLLRDGLEGFGFVHADPDRNLGSVDAGPGRTNAFGVILNEVASRALEVKTNAQTANAETAQMGQAFGRFNAEEYSKIHRGEAVFAVNCAGCHSENPELVTMVPFAEFDKNSTRNRPFVGTDPVYFGNLAKSWSNADTGRLSDTSVLRELNRKDPEVAKRFRNPYLGMRFDAKYKQKDIVIEVLADTTMGIFLKYMKANAISMDPTDRDYQYLTGGTLSAKQTHVGAFKARSLHGIAFTGPYFHNGSVRTLREVLSPEERSAEFFIGGTGYDQKNGGFENAGRFHFRANKMGNLNIGHDFAADLSAAQKEDLLMYLKSL